MSEFQDPPGEERARVSATMGFVLPFVAAGRAEHEPWSVSLGGRGVQMLGDQVWTGGPERDGGRMGRRLGHNARWVRGRV